MPTDDSMTDGKSRTRTLTRNKTALKRPSMWNVIILNDDYTPMDFVVFVLKTVFGMEHTKAEALMWQVHIEGKAVAGTYTFEVAETKHDEAMGLARLEGHPLKLALEPAPEV